MKLFEKAWVFSLFWGLLWAAYAIFVISGFRTNTSYTVLGTEKAGFLSESYAYLEVNSEPAEIIPAVMHYDNIPGEVIAAAERLPYEEAPGDENYVELDDFTEFVELNGKFFKVIFTGGPEGDVYLVQHFPKAEQLSGKNGGDLLCENR